MGSFNFHEFVSAFIIMFAVIDAIGATPIIISLRDSGKIVKPIKATVLSHNPFECTHEYPVQLFVVAP
jgi:multiple antibiotic resistance protein